jgi:shikimate dehydrogenase
MVISSETRLVALLGHPVAHSLSPRMQNAAFAARGLDWAYVALDGPPERLAEAVRGLAAAGFAGANVTSPHKVAAAKLCDEADAESVNTLVFEGGRVVGTSTDAAVLEGLMLDRPLICHL